MLPLSAGELKQMRDTATVYLGGTAIVSSPTRSSDSQGGETWAYTASGTVAGRVQPLPRGDTEMALADRLGVVNPFIITLPYNTTINSTYRVTMGTVTYEVKTLLPHVPWEITRRMLAEQVQ